MPSISEKAKLMPPSPIRKLVPFAEKAKQKGIKIYHLNIGQPDLPTPEVALNAVKNNNLEIIEYGHSAGNLSYRKKLALYYQKVGIDVSYENILITTGGSEAILFAFMVCLNPDDEVIVPEPYYANYNGFAVQAGITIKPIVSSIKQNFALPPIEKFEELISKKTKAILICNPNNPTGYLYSQAELEKLAYLVKKYDLFLFADEVYREFCYDGKKHFSILNLNGLEDNAIMLDSVSKRYSMCGARVGAIVTRNVDVLNATLKFAQARLCPPAFGQIAAEAAIDTPDSYFKMVYEEYVERRNLMVNMLNSIPGVYCPMPSGAFYTVASFPIDNSDKFCEWLLTDFEYNGQTVMMAPASGFYSNPEHGKNECRLAYVLKKEDIKNAIETLSVALKQYSKKI
ncbi:MAG: pyridoxal phosphate-dependent aminotransferase [Bacteroidales bacterium]|nr:pyridoxal phosphate-dependent aminotransferase [Bacteroidales bacterium]